MHKRTIPLLLLAAVIGGCRAEAQNVYGLKAISSMTEYRALVKEDPR